MSGILRLQPLLCPAQHHGLPIQELSLTVNGWNEKLTTQSQLLPNIIHVGKSTYGAWAQNMHYSLKIILVCKTLNISGNHNGWKLLL